MTYILFFLLLGLATVLIVDTKRLQKQNNNYAITRQRLKEAEMRSQEAERQCEELSSRLQKQNNDYAITQQRLQEAEMRSQEAERQYEELISKTNNIEDIDKQITVTRDQPRQINEQAKVEEQELSEKISVLRELEAQEKEHHKRKKIEEQKLSEKILVLTTKLEELKVQEEKYKKRIIELQRQENQYQEQQIIFECMREEEKALRELEKARQDAQQEEDLYQEALEVARKEIESQADK